MALTCKEDEDLDDYFFEGDEDEGDEEDEDEEDDEC